MILGYPWLHMTNPSIDWNEGTLNFDQPYQKPYCLCQILRQRLQQPKQPISLHLIEVLKKCFAQPVATLAKEKNPITIH